MAGASLKSAEALTTTAVGFVWHNADELARHTESLLAACGSLPPGGGRGHPAHRRHQYDPEVNDRDDAFQRLAAGSAPIGSTTVSAS